MEQLWTWGGRYFGYRSGTNLWTHDRRNVGRFQGNEVYGTDGQYLGELTKGRLITSTSKLSRGSTFAPECDRVGIVQSVEYVGNVMIGGYDDFPDP